MPDRPAVIYPPLAWLEPHENIFGIRCLDVRGLTQAWSASTSDVQAQRAFQRQRSSDGSYCLDLAHAWQPGLACDLRYPPLPPGRSGVLFRAEVMEDKWTIYPLADGCLYFCRSWSGAPLFRAAAALTPAGLQLTRLDWAPELPAPQPGELLSTLDFLVKSHIYGLQVPVQAPRGVFFHVHAEEGAEPVEHPSELESVASYLYHEYGQRAAFATLEDTTHLALRYDRSTFLEGPFPLGRRNLKARISVSESSVECPVAGCGEAVERQKEKFTTEARYQCPQHHIYISPSTFAYPAEGDNLLWRGPADLALLEKVEAVKRERGRLAGDNSEDALTWNVFRYLETSGMLAPILSSMHGGQLDDLQVYYWGYDRHTGRTWAPLKTARQQFGEKPQAGSEPDLVISAPQALFFFEASFNASHNTTPPANPAVAQKYTTAAAGWYRKVFRSSFQNIAVERKRYELLRLWLLGSKIASLAGQAFYLVAVSPEAAARPLAGEFSSLILEGEERAFISTAWEQLYQFIARGGPTTRQTQQVLAYLENKTAGYADGSLVPAFEVSLW